MTEQYLKPNPEALKNIDHIVVLMMENHSFDNMLGWLYDDTPPPNHQSFEGVSDYMWNPLNVVDSNGTPFVEQVYVRKNGQAPKKGSYGVTHKIKYKVDYCQPNPDPGEGFKDTNQQLFGYYDVPGLYPPTPTNQGFVNNYAAAMLYSTGIYGDLPTNPRDIMSCYTPEQTPVLSTLAKSFAVCDQYHCSVPSQTLPNRDFVHAATSDGNVNNDPYGYCNARTIYQQIQDAIDNDNADISWGVYSGTSYDKKEHKWVPFSLTRTIMTQLQNPKFDDNFKHIEQFATDVKKQQLPSYTFLEPQFSGKYQNDQHPPQDIRPGEQLMADIYNILKESELWEKTLFVITYDEHGGCFDHVAPPSATPPDGSFKYPFPDGSHKQPGLDDFWFNRFGVRVPTVVISPWIDEGLIGRPEGYVPFDHTSIIATVQNRFNLKGHLTERDKAAPDLSCLLNRDTPRCDKPEVTPLPLPSTHGTQSQENDLQHLSVQMLVSLTGITQKEDESAHDYIERAYHDYFSDKNRKPA